jgi:hypothetical protein
MYTIIEDCSPYYIRFTYSGIGTIVEQFSDEHYNYQDILDNSKHRGAGGDFVHHKLSPENGTKLLEQVPMNSLIPMNHERVSLFVSRQGCIYRPHKDGLSVRCGINYNVKILDDKCVTGWYDDQELSIYPIDTLNGRSREAAGFVRSQHKPIKTMVAKQSECVLFNTDIYHDWNNGNSNNIRVLLTLRFRQADKIYFSDARRILFGY